MLSPVAVCIVPFRCVSGAGWLQACHGGLGARTRHMQNTRYWRRRYWRAPIVTAATVAILAYSIFMMLREDWKANTGFLVFGALLAVLATLMLASLKRPADVADLSRAIHTELADRVARCCFDYEAPWGKYDQHEDNRPMDPNRLRRFASFPPIIYPATAGQIAILDDDALQSLMKFYYRLAAWQRDVENTADACDRGASAQTGDLWRLGRRLRETLKPGIEALKAFDKVVRDPHKIEDDLLAAYDVFRKDLNPAHDPIPSLRERLQSCIAAIEARRTEAAATES